MSGWLVGDYSCVRPGNCLDMEVLRVRAPWRSKVWELSQIIFFLFLSLLFFCVVLVLAFYFVFFVIDFDCD